MNIFQGMVTFKDASLQEKVKKELETTADHIAFLSIAKLEDSVTEDVKFLKNSSLLLKDILISGWLYDVKKENLIKLFKIQIFICSNLLLQLNMIA